MKYQYYYKNNDCKASEATDADCICWHDEGTGPFPDIRYSSRSWHNIPSFWRVKPEANFNHNKEAKP